MDLVTTNDTLCSRCTVFGEVEYHIAFAIGIPINRGIKILFTENGMENLF